MLFRNYSWFLVVGGFVYFLIDGHESASRSLSASFQRPLAFFLRLIGGIRAILCYALCETFVGSPHFPCYAYQNGFCCGYCIQPSKTLGCFARLGIQWRGVAIASGSTCDERDAQSRTHV